MCCAFRHVELHHSVKTGESAPLRMGGAVVEIVLPGHRSRSLLGLLVSLLEERFVQRIAMRHLLATLSTSISQRSNRKKKQQKQEEEQKQASQGIQHADRVREVGGLRVDAADLTHG